MAKVDFMNLIPELEKLILENGFKYFRNIQKEHYSVNSFMMCNISAAYVLELAKKLIAIKRHPDYRNDKFWISATLNVHGLYSYQVQIENIFEVISPPTPRERGELEKPKISNEDKWIQHCKEAFASGKTVRAFDDLPKKLQTEKVRMVYDSNKRS